MILAAGMGTRLRPVTETIPKALVPVHGKTMLDRVIQRLIRIGVTMIVVNTHHFSDQVCTFVQSRDWGIPVTVVVEEGGLETAGGVAHAAHLLQDSQPIVLHNVDILSSIDLTKMYLFHNQSSAYITLAVRTPANNRPLLINELGIVVGHKNKLKGTETVLSNTNHSKEVNFCGIHVMSQKVLAELHANRTNWKGKSLTEFYLSLIPTHTITTFDVSPSFWLDIGTPEKFAFANSLEHNIDFLS